MNETQMESRAVMEAEGGWLCVCNPGRIKLKGVLLDFYVNNVHQHMAGKRVVDAPLIKWGHLVHQQDWTQPEMRPVLSAGPFHTEHIWLCMFALNAKVQIFIDFHNTANASHYHLQYVTTTSKAMLLESIYDSCFYQRPWLHAAR